MKFFAFLSRLSAVPVVLTLLFFNVFYVPAQSVGLLTEEQKEQSTLLEAGYHWRWTGFVPGFWKFDLIEKNNLFSNIALQLPLKYASFFGMEEVFNFEIKAQMEYHIDFTNADMAKKWHTYFGEKSDEENKNYIKEKVEGFIKQQFYRFYQSEKDVLQLAQKIKEYIEDMQAIQTDWHKDEGLAYFELVSFSLTHWQVPDIALYNRLSQNINFYVEQKNRVDLRKLELENQKQEEENLLDLELVRLKKIGELIRENPYILAYLRIEKINEQATLVLAEDSLNNKLSLFSNPSSSLQSSVKPKWSLPDTESSLLLKP